MACFWQRSLAVAVAAALCVLLLAVPEWGAADSNTPYTQAASTIPPLELIFGQSFRVSVMTQSFGTFNATLRMRSSLNFPEKVQGELIPIGEPTLTHSAQHRLPHFARARSVEDDRLADIPMPQPEVTVSGPGQKGSADKSAHDEFTTPGEEERPSLLLVDVQLQRSDALSGVVHAYYLPAELVALRTRRAALGEGSVSPSAAADFTFRQEAVNMTKNPLSDVPDVARVCSASVTVANSPEALHGATDSTHGNGVSDITAEAGTVIFRWITEHEFSMQLSLPIPEMSSGVTAHKEKVWVYGYATPSASVYDRKQRELPWYNKYLMFGACVAGLVAQIISGASEGKAKASRSEKIAALRKAQDKAVLEGQLKEQEQHSKKKK